MKRFPIDCPADCPYFYCLNIGEDISFDCDLLNKQAQIDVNIMDIMDLFNDTLLPICPLKERKETE